MKISQVEWSKGLSGKGEDRSAFIIWSVIDNNHFATNLTHFRDKDIHTSLDVGGVVAGDSDG
jgi:hypothetical protein